MPVQPNQAVAHVQLTINGVSLDTDVVVSRDPTRAREMLPLFRAFAGALQSAGERLVADAGMQISCRKGCGACCRQLVPVSPAEAHMIRDLVDSMPEPRRSIIRERFAAAVNRAQHEGLTAELTDPGRHDEDQADELARRYFAMKLPCPFLEDESCSIHSERPIRCREILVTTPPEYCVDPWNQPVKNAPVIAKASVAAMRVEDDPNKPFLQWAPLIFALQWSADHPEAPAQQSGAQLLSTFLQNLGREPQYPAR